MAASDLRTDPPAATRAGWQCPACLTVYSPDVEACRCATRKPLSERLKQDRPIQLGGGMVRFPQVEPGGAPLGVTAPVCTCPPVWGGIVPPPACPAHGQVQMFRVTC